MDLTVFEVILIISGFLNNTLSSYEWDDFISIPIKDLSLEEIRIVAQSLPKNFPSDKKSEYCNEKGVQKLQEILKLLMFKVLFEFLEKTELDDPKSYKGLEQFQKCSEMTVLISHLEQFFSDVDIRCKDEKYCLMQHAEMKKFIKLLKSNAPIKMIEKITFLEPTEDI